MKEIKDMWLCRMHVYYLNQKVLAITLIFAVVGAILYDRAWFECSAQGYNMMA